MVCAEEEAAISSAAARVWRAVFMGELVAPDEIGIPGGASESGIFSGVLGPRGGLACLKPAR